MDVSAEGLEGSEVRSMREFTPPQPTRGLEERHSVFCFNSFNQTAIILRYSAHIKPRKTIKIIKTVTHKHNMTLIMSS